MKRLKRTHLIVFGLGLALLIAAVWLSAHPRPPRYALASTEAQTVHWSTVDGGGGTGASSGGYSLSGTLGQHDAGPAQGMSGSGYQLHGGFWPGADTAYHHYLPVVNR